jgi:L-glutamine:2-deoxy-scyllo-inosose/3-amino-2,3-dideoxy-scyllo-inosose aminotransferase
LIGKLAVNGGVPVRTREFMNWPISTQREIDLVNEVIRSGNWAWNGPKELEFAAKFAKFQDTGYGICAMNGTVTLEIALKVCGICPGDEVIVPALTWVATASSALFINAIPVFVDVDPQTYCIDPKAIESAITERTKAIIPVHLFASLADMDKITEIAKKRDLIVIEDCAHSHGSKWKGKGVGSWGRAGSFSFQKSKVMPSGEGGIITTNDVEIAEKSYSFKDCGRTRKEVCLSQNDSPNVLGWNYRITEFQAAVLLAQLERLPGQLEKREKNMKYLTKALSSMEGVTPVTTLNDPRVTMQSFYRYVFKYNPSFFDGKSARSFRRALTQEGIPCGEIYQPVYKSNLFVTGGKCCPTKSRDYKGSVDYSRVFCPVTEKAWVEAVALNHEMFLGTTQDIDDIIEAIAKVKKFAAELKD